MHPPKYNRYRKEKKITLVLNFLLVFTAVIIFGTACGLPYWVTYKPYSNGPIYYRGLFQFCIVGLDTTACGIKVDISGMTVSVIVAASIAFCADLISVLVALNELLVKKANNSKQTIIVTLLSNVSSVLMSSLVIILFYFDVEILKPTFHVCFYLGAASVFLILLSTGIVVYRFTRGRFKFMPKFTKIRLTPVQPLHRPKKEVEEW